MFLRISWWSICASWVFEPKMDALRQLQPYNTHEWHGHYLHQSTVAHLSQWQPRAAVSAGTSLAHPMWSSRHWSVTYNGNWLLVYGAYDVTYVWVLCNFDFSSIHEVSNFGLDSLLGLTTGTFGVVWDWWLGFGVGLGNLVREHEMTYNYLTIGIGYQFGFLVWCWD